MKKESCQCRVLYLSIIPFKIKGKIKTFSDEQKLRELTVRWQFIARNAKGSKYFRLKRNYIRWKAEGLGRNEKCYT